MNDLSQIRNGVAPRIEPFADPDWTASGQPRARAALRRLETLWINTGTLCNLACAGCYIDSSPRNDSLALITRAEVQPLLEEARRLRPEAGEIGFTGGEPFVNPDLLGMIEDALALGFRVLVLTNAMKPMRRVEDRLAVLGAAHPGRIAFRVSLDDHTREGHEAIRGPRSWAPAVAGLRWLVDAGFDTAIAARLPAKADEVAVRDGFQRLFDALGLGIDAADRRRLVLFPELGETKPVPEISEACWGILGKSPADVMCASSRMVVRRKGEARPHVVACTLLPHDLAFDLGTSLAEAARPVSLNHRHCARFCVLGGASCSA